jgi:hypothetical protein
MEFILIILLINFFKLHFEREGFMWERGKENNKWMKILKIYRKYYNSQRVWEKEVNTMVNDVEILKGHLKNSHKGFFFM